MKLLSFAVTLLLLLGFAPLPSNFHRVEDSISAISFNMDGDPDHQMRCTGFQVGITRVLTAEHCLPQHNEDIYVDGKLSRVVSRNGAFGLLDVEPGKPLLSIGAKPKRGDEVWAWGHAYGEELLVLFRHVAGYQGEHLITDGNFANGMSGGPVLNADGKVVGVIQAGNDTIGIACAPDEIKDFLK